MGHRDTTPTLELSMLTTAPSPSPKHDPRAFEDLLMTAVRGPSFRSTRTFALDHGVDEPALLRYASGAVSMYERLEIEAVVRQCDWARQFVVQHVKSTRYKQGNRNAA